MCEHPRVKWVGMADGIHCGVCGQIIDLDTPKKAPESKVEPEPEKKPEKKPASKTKKGGTK